MSKYMGSDKGSDIGMGTEGSEIASLTSGRSMASVTSEVTSLTFKGA